MAPAPVQVLKGHTFATAGKLDKPQKHYEELIAKHGGTAVATINLSTKFLISNEDGVREGKQQITFAKKHGIPIIREGFVGACVAEGKLLDSSYFEIHLAGKKRKAEPKAAAPKKRKVAPIYGLSNDIEVIEKSGMCDKCKVVQEAMKQGFMTATLTWNAELLLHKPDEGKDKFFNLQLLGSLASDGQYWVVRHWGRTGMPGAVDVRGPMASLEKAKRIFKEKFRERTGNSWGYLAATFVEQPNKYKLLVSADGAKEVEPEEEKGEGLWQYYLHNKVDGKKLGWYNYQASAAKNMEKYWLQFKRNPGLDVRIIRSDYFRYEVNFTEMIQCNQTSGMRRVIRRVPPSQKDDPPTAPPEKIPEAKKPLAKTDASDDGDDEEEAEEAEEEEDEEAEEEAAEAEEEAAEAEEEAAEAEEEVEPEAEKEAKPEGSPTKRGSPPRAPIVAFDRKRPAPGDSEAAGSPAAKKRAVPGDSGAEA